MYASTISVMQSGLKSIRVHLVLSFCTVSWSYFSISSIILFLIKHFLTICRISQKAIPVSMNNMNIEPFYFRGPGERE